MMAIGKSVSAVVLALVLAGGAASCSPPSEQSATERLDREADNDPVISAIREADPALYARIRDEAAGLMAQGATMEQARTAAHQAARAYIGEQMGSIAAAPSEAQAAAFTAERDLLQVLRGVDVEACAAAAMGVPINDSSLSQQDGVSEAFGNAIGARLHAASEGQSTPTQHAAIQEADALAVRDAMIADGMDERVVNGMMMGAINAMSSQDKCDGTIGFSDAILAQPTASRDRLLAMVFNTLAGQAR